MRTPSTPRSLSSRNGRRAVSQPGKRAGLDRHRPRRVHDRPGQSCTRRACSRPISTDGKFTVDRARAAPRQPASRQRAPRARAHEIGLAEADEIRPSCFARYSAASARATKLLEGLDVWHRMKRDPRSGRLADRSPWAAAGCRTRGCASARGSRPRGRPACPASAAETPRRPSGREYRSRATPRVLRARTPAST